MPGHEITRLGRYEILGELGRGAMGVVYKARDPQISRLVALKSIRLYGLEPEQQEEFRKRFMVEAQAAGRLQHPGIVSIFDIGEDPESHEPFIVLEYVAGESLSRILSRDKKVPLSRALQLAEELADALDYAHSQGVVHRDIKPANILVTEDGHAKITDFGIAKLNLAHFTLPGRVLGTPAYMAPEQLVGDAADNRSDLFSLGVILYAMVTGHPPFHGDSATTVCFKVVNREPVPASAFDLELPRALDPVISRAMAKDPAERYQRGSELADDLRQLRLQFTASMTGSLIPRVSTTTGMRTLGATSRLNTKVPQQGLQQAHGLWTTALRRTSMRDLIYGTGLVVIFIMLAIPVRRSLESAKTPAENASLSSIDVSHPDPKLHSVVEAPAVDSARVATNKSHAASHRKRKNADPGDDEGSNQSGSRAHSGKTVVVPSSNVELAIQHQFKDATLMVWIDDKLALTRSLHGGTQRHLVVFNGVHGVGSETLQVPAGIHTLRLRAQSTDMTTDLSRSVTAEFIGGGDRTLQVTFDKHNTAMHLSWQ